MIDIFYLQIFKTTLNQVLSLDVKKTFRTQFKFSREVIRILIIKINYKKLNIIMHKVIQGKKLNKELFVENIILVITKLFYMSDITKF